jgi:malonyl-CoA/methylmalonyl-CoA synthetase
MFQPTMFMRLMRHYEEHILQSTDQIAYIQGVRAHRFMMSGTSALPRPLRMKWFTLSGGKRILERYGASEFGTGILTPLKNNELVPDVR